MSGKVSTLLFFLRPVIKLPGLLSVSQLVGTGLSVVISVMCGAIVLFAIVFLVYDARNRKRSSRVARHIVIASAAFDEFGRILVKADGTLPMHIIETDAAIDVSLRRCNAADDSVC